MSKAATAPPNSAAPSSPRPHDTPAPAGRLVRATAAEQVWMSHGDHVSEHRPRLSGLRHLAQRPLRHHRRPRAPFLRRAVPPRGAPHPQGRAALRELRRLAGFKGDWTMGAYREEAIAKIRAQVGDAKVICGLSGGVDQSVAAVLIHEAIGDQLTCVFVDHGLLRLGEAEQVVTMFRDHYNMPADPRRRKRPVPWRAGGRLRPRGQAQDHRPPVHRRVPETRQSRSAAPNSWPRARFTPT